MSQQTIQEVEAVLRQLEVLAGSEVPEIPAGADGDVLRHLATGLQIRYADLLGVVQTLAGDLRHAHGILQDLQMSREPDVERLFMDIIIANNGKMDCATAWAMAQSTIEFRNKKRAEKKI